MRARLIALLMLVATQTTGAQSPAPKTFDVASVKANRSGQPIFIRPILQLSGRVFAVNQPLRDLITVAFGLQENQLIVSSPLADATFDLEARAGAGTATADATAMLRALLVDRFSLKTHQETRQLPVYNLVRLNDRQLGQQIKPSGSECAPLKFPEGPGAPPPPPPPPPAMAGFPLGNAQQWAECPTMFHPGGLSARAMNMEAFSIALARMVRRPVIDKTGLSGNFDFDMSFAPPDFLPAAPQGAVVGGPAGPPEAVDFIRRQSALPSLDVAIRDQLGLRLESGRAAVDVLVIDSVQPPTEN
jgi:uncharacterized protein (TIGR03435 family)